MIDLLRSNFACNSVPLWGKYRDYIDMLSATIDLLRNVAISEGEDWLPGMIAEREIDKGDPTNRQEAWFSDSGIASAEEMLYLYNELGLAYYNTGSVQDALSVWLLAFEWQKAVAKGDPSQGEMYDASLNSHIGMAELQLGRLQRAADCFQVARNRACSTSNPDLEARMSGMLARVDHFRGNVTQARLEYLRVIQLLDSVGNLRAKSYFTDLFALETRLENFKEANIYARESKAIAASQNTPDLIAFATEMEGRALSAAKDNEGAIRKFRMALLEAQRLDISRLFSSCLASPKFNFDWAMRTQLAEEQRTLWSLPMRTYWCCGKSRRKFYLEK